jgi:hypothetical protein
MQLAARAHRREERTQVLRAIRRLCRPRRLALRVRD